MLASNGIKLSKEEIRKEVSQLLDNPILENTSPEVARISFFVNNDMEIIVIDVNADTDRVENMVKSRLHHKKVSSANEDDLYTMFNINVTFKATDEL
jgi:hypothetical protein